MPLVCGVLGIPPICAVFPRPPPLQICGGVLHSYVTRSQRLRQGASRWGCFFWLFFGSLVQFSTVFFSFLMPLLCILYTFFSAFLSGFLCVFVMYPLFLCEHYGETGSSPAGRGDCGGDDNCIIETKAAGFH